MNLCMACAYPSTPVLNGLCRTCGLVRAAGTSLQINAIQRDTIDVDNNLYGVSPQVTDSGVLVFEGIFAALRQGKGGLAAPAEKYFATAASGDRHASAPAAPGQRN
jgi:hypothetical protein